MSTPLTNNTERIRQLISQIENLPDAGSGGVELPTLENPGAAEHLLQDKELINEVGVKVVGTMPNNGEVSRTMDGVNTKSVSIPAGYTSGGTVSLDDTIDNAVSDALAVITEKGVTVPAGTKVDGLADLIAAIESGGADISKIGFTKATFGTTVGSTSFVHNLGETPKCILFWSDDVYDYVDLGRVPQQYIRAGIGMVISGVDGTKEVVESYVTCLKAGSQEFFIASPTAACPRSGFDVYYNPTTSNPGIIMTTTNPTNQTDDKNTIFVHGRIASGYTYALHSAATYHWGVFA